MFKKLCFFIGAFGTFIAPLSASIFAPNPSAYNYMYEIWSKLPTQHYNLIIEEAPENIAYAFGNEVHISTGFMSLAPKDEMSFIVSHEVSHLIHDHCAEAMFADHQLSKNPMTMSGHTFDLLGAKFQENQADMLGQALYLSNGGDPHLFDRLYDREVLKLQTQHPKWSSLSPMDSHFSFLDRFTKLKNVVHNKT